MFQFGDLDGSGPSSHVLVVLCPTGRRASIAEGRVGYQRTTEIYSTSMACHELNYDK